MKKSNIILTLILIWFSVFSYATSPGLAVEFMHIDHETYEVEDDFVWKINVVHLYDHTITLEWNSTRPLSMLFVKKSILDFQTKVFNFQDKDLWDITYEEKLALKPIWIVNATEQFNRTSPWRVPDNEVYVIVFINLNAYDANVTVSLTKNEIGTASYIFGGIISVLFFGSIFIIMRKKSKLLSHPDEIEENRDLNQRTED